MGYEDFVIQLGSDARGSTVRVARSPAGETDVEPLVLSPDADEFLEFAASLGRVVDGGRQSRDLVLRRDVHSPPVSVVGARLFRALLPEAAHRCLQQSLGRVAERGRGLRIRIEIGLGSSELVRLQAVPWEFLASDGHFLSLSREISIVRHVSVGLPGDRPPVPPPLRIIVLAGESLSGSDLDLAAEQRLLEQAWSDPGALPAKVHLLPDCTLDALREELLTQEYHVLHFMGHGAFSSGTGEGALAFRSEEGRRVWVNGSELAEQLRDRNSLRLVFLNACDTAQASAVAPYAGVATALLKAGIPAVVAMQFPISDATALVLGRVFYRRISRGDTVDAALAEGRMAIRRQAPDGYEWGTPVLFERLTNGEIVEPTPPPTPSRARSPISWGWAVVLIMLIVGAFLVFAWEGLSHRRGPTSMAQPPSTNSKAGEKLPETVASDPEAEQLPAQVGSDTQIPSQRKPAAQKPETSETHKQAESSEEPTYPQAPARECSTSRNTYDQGGPIWFNSSEGGFGIEDSVFKMHIDRPNSGEKRCQHCRVDASAFKISATVWSTGVNATWGLYILDMSEVRGEMYSFEVGPKGHASIKWYRDDYGVVVLWSGSYTANEKDRLTLEAEGGVITATANGTRLALATYDETKVPKVPLGAGYLVATNSDIMVDTRFDDYEFTACPPTRSSR